MTRREGLAMTSKKENPLLNPPPQRGGGNEKNLIFPLL